MYLVQVLICCWWTQLNCLCNLWLASKSNYYVFCVGFATLNWKLLCCSTMKKTKQQNNNVKLSVCLFVWGKTLYTSHRYVICLQSQSPAVSSNIAINKNLTSQIIADISVEDLLHGFVSCIDVSIFFCLRRRDFCSLFTLSSVYVEL